jgi:hypothetical protein
MAYAVSAPLVMGTSVKRALLSVKRALLQMAYAVSAPLVMPLRDSDIPMNVPFTFRNKQPFPQMPYGHRSLQLLLFKPPRWAIDRGGATVALTDPEDPEISLLKPSPESRTAPACASVGPCPAAAAEGETARFASNATDSLPLVAQNRPVSGIPQLFFTPSEGTGAHVGTARG